MSKNRIETMEIRVTYYINHEKHIDFFKTYSHYGKWHLNNYKRIKISDIQVKNNRY